MANSDCASIEICLGGVDLQGLFASEVLGGEGLVDLHVGKVIQVLGLKVHMRDTGRQAPR